MRDIPVKIKAKPILQGATYTLSLLRKYLPYTAVKGECGSMTNSCTGEAVDDADMTLENYAGCEAKMQIRAEAGAADVLFEASTADGSIVLNGASLLLTISAATTAAFTFKKGVGHIEITRPDATVERQYELLFKLSPEVTL